MRLEDYLTPELAEYVFSNPAEIEFQGRKVFVLNPSILAASKQLPYADREPRIRDIEDMKLLQVPTEQVHVVIQKLQEFQNK